MNPKLERSSSPANRHPLGVVFVGAGMVAELHHRALIRLSSTWTLRGIVEPDDNVAQRRVREWSCHRYASYDQALADASVTAVLVLAPYQQHERLASAALAAGKHVLVEKPVATAAAIHRLAAQANATGLVCMPGHNYAYQPEFTQLRSLIRDGSLGTIRALWITYAITHPEHIAARYAGVLEEVMIHHSYLALALLGTPGRLNAGRMQPAWEHHREEDQAWMTWEYDGRCSAHLFASFAVGDDSADPWTFVVKALGTNGSGTYTWRSMVFRRALGTLPIAIPAYEDSYIHQLSAFASAVYGDAAAIISPLCDAAGAAELLDLARASADDGHIRSAHTRSAV